FANAGQLARADGPGEGAARRRAARSRRDAPLRRGRGARHSHARPHARELLLLAQDARGHAPPLRRHPLPRLDRPALPPGRRPRSDPRLAQDAAPHARRRDARHPRPRPGDADRPRTPEEPFPSELDAMRPSSRATVAVAALALLGPLAATTR